MSPAHETRVDRAFALNGWVVFCSCGKLTGFADDAAGADKIAADHVTKHESGGWASGGDDPLCPPRDAPAGSHAGLRGGGTLAEPPGRPER